MLIQFNYNNETEYGVGYTGRLKTTTTSLARPKEKNQ